MSEISNTNFIPQNPQDQNCLLGEPQDNSKKPKYIDDSHKSDSKLEVQSKTLARFRDFSASFEQQDRFYVQERIDEQESKSTIFDVRQKINNKLVAKIIINKVFDKRNLAILIINSSNIHIAPIKNIFKILPVRHEVWIINVGKINDCAANLLCNMFREYEPPLSKFTTNNSILKFFIENTNSRLICKFEVKSKLNICLLKNKVLQTESYQTADVSCMYIRDQSLLIIKNSQHSVICLQNLKANENDGQLIALKRYRSLSKQYESEELISNDLCYELNFIRVENRSELSSNESESSDSEYSWRKIKISKGDSAEDIKTSSNDFLSSLSANTILEGKCQNLELSSLISTVDSYGFYPEISASSNPASNPTPSVYSMLTEDQKLTKLFDVIGQINDGGKYLCRFEKESSKYN